jgi:WD40 repeat protein/energy-coupling factor transporter ATP-binding protein EcfA2
MSVEALASEQRFSSLEAMKAAHLDFIKMCPPGHTPSSAQLDEIETFIVRGRATGVLLDAHNQQRDAQCLLDHWAGYLTKYRRDVDSTLAEYDPNEAPSLKGVECPYPGLEAFQTADSAHFFGRTQLIHDLVHRLETERFLAIVGPSGSGKSSLILAGLVPALLRDRAWERSVRVVPGADPLESLAHAVGRLPDDGPAWLERRVEELRRTPTALPALLDATGVATVLVVDQFEETFTICGDGEARQAFEASLVALIQGSRLRHRLLLSMRSDYEGHLTRMPSLWPEFVRAKVALLPLGPGDLREAIESPARQVGLKFEDGLVDALYSDVNGEAAALPLLQVILRKLWQNKHRNLVTWNEYKKLGNGRIALSKTADEFYNGLIPEEQMRVKRIFIRLVRPAAGQEVTSNRISRRNLSRSLQDAGWVDDTIQRLRAAGLIRVTAGDSPADDEIEVAHEALVRNWPTLVDWLNQERSTMTMGRRLESRIAEWIRLGAGTAGLLDDESLAEVNRWLQDPDAALLGNSEQLDRFIVASQAAIDENKREQEEAQQREIELHRSITRQKSLKARQARYAVVALTLLSVAAVVLAIAAQQGAKSAIEQRTAAEDNAKRADQNASLAEDNAKAAKANLALANSETKLASQRKEEVEKLNVQLREKARFYDSGKLAVRAQRALPDAEASLMLASASARWIYPREGDEMWQAAGAIRDALREARTTAIFNPPGNGKILAAAFTPDGLKLVTLSNDDSVILWDTVRAALIAKRERVSTASGVIAISPDGRRIAVGGAKEVALLDAESLAVLCLRSGGPATSLEFNPDSQRLATFIANDVIISTVDSCSAGPTILRVGSPGQMAFSGDGGSIATLDQNGKLRLWDVATRKELLSIPIDSGAHYNALAFKPDGAQVAVGTDRFVKIFSTSPRSTSVGQPNLPTGPPFSLSALSDDVTTLAYNRRGDFLAAASRDGTVTVWNADDRRPLFTFAGPRGGAASVAFSPDSTRLVTTGDDGFARIWSATSTSVLANVGTGSYHLAFSRDRSRLGLYGSNGVVHVAFVLNPSNGSEIRILQSSRPVAMAIDSTSGRVVIATDKGEVTLYDAAGRKIRTWPPAGRSLSLAMSPGGDSVAVVTAGSVSIFPQSGEPKSLADASGVQSISYSPNGERFVTATDKVLTLWDAASGRPIRSIANVGKVSSILFGDGRISAQVDGNLVRTWTADLEEPQDIRSGSGPLLSLDLTPDLKNLITVSSTDGVTLWDGMGKVLTNLLPAKAGPLEAVFLKDGRTAVLTREGLVYSLPVGIADAIRAGLSSLVRAWDQSECVRLTQLESSFCAQTVPALQRMADGNRAARAGNVEDARSFYASAIARDPWLKDFTDPSRQASEHAARSTNLALRVRASGLAARGESLAALAATAKGDPEEGQDAKFRKEAIGYFEQAGEPDPLRRAQGNQDRIAKERSQVLVNTGRFLAGRTDSEGLVDNDANAIAKSYLERAKRMNAAYTFEPAQEIASITARKLNELCWERSLLAATATDRRHKAEAISQACDEAVRLAPKDADYLDSRGLNLLLRGKGEEARKDFEAFIASEALASRKALRSRWVASLNDRPDQNPLTEDDIKLLRLWSNLQTN